MTFASDYLPSDTHRAHLIGRVQLPASPAFPERGPTPVLVREGKVYDLFSLAPTLAHLCALPELIAALDAASEGEPSQ